MRPTPISALIALFLAPVMQAAAQGTVVSMGCHGACAERPAPALALDSVRVWAILDPVRATTYVDHSIRNATADSVEGAFFFPLPAGAEVSYTWVHAGPALETYGEWTPPDEARQMLDGLAREQPGAGLSAYAGREMVLVRVPPIAPHGVKRLRIAYTQPLRMDGGPVAYRYPLSVAAGAAPAPHLELGLTVTTQAGFRDFSSPTHAVRVEWGTEVGRCPPRSRCGFTSVPSRRVKIVRLEPAADVRARDFELVYTPEPGPTSGAAEQP